MDKIWDKDILNFIKYNDNSCLSDELENDNNLKDANSYPEVDIGNGDKGTFLSEENYSEIIKGIINFVNQCNLGTKFRVLDNYKYNSTNGSVVKLDLSQDSICCFVENLVLSYLIENPYIMPVVDFDVFGYEYLPSFNINDDYDFVDEVKLSIYNDALEKTKDNGYSFFVEKLDQYVESIYNMDNDIFLDKFKPMIEKVAIDTNRDFDNLTEVFLNKKNNIKNVFAALKKEYDFIYSKVKEKV